MMLSVMRMRPQIQKSSLVNPRLVYPSQHRYLHNTAYKLLDTERNTPSAPTSATPFPFPTSKSKRFPIPTLSSPTSAPARPRRKITSVDQLPASFGRNQIIPVKEDIRKELEAIVGTFKAPIRYAFAYGSGVFSQSGYTAEDKPLLDFVFAVSHPSHWHAINMQQNPTHYSLPMRLLGSDAVAWMQQKGLGAEVWFNVEVEVNGKIIKYGCISIDSLCHDLLEWQTLYISGRTQKPVRILIDDSRVRLANQVNLASAFRTALLLLPEEFTESQLYEQIASISYLGDFRMRIGENPLKVRNIVEAQLDSFRLLYGGLIKSFWRSVKLGGESSSSNVIGMGGVRMIKQDVSKERRALTASNLPVGVKSKLLAKFQGKTNLRRAAMISEGGSGSKVIAEEMDQTELWINIVEDAEFKQMLIQSLSEIVAKPTFNQSLKGILSAGPLKSLRYILPKLKKKWSARPATRVEEDKKSL